MKPRFDANGQRQYQHIDRVIRRKLRTRGDGCGICHGQLGPIDYDAHQYAPLAFEVDHIVPISRGGQKTLENSRASHRTCNRQRSNTIDADAIEAGAQPEAPGPTAAPAACPPGPCTGCNGVHNPHPGVTFTTTRRWTP